MCQASDKYPILLSYQDGWIVVEFARRFLKNSSARSKAQDHWYNIHEQQWNIVDPKEMPKLTIPNIKAETGDVPAYE